MSHASRNRDRRGYILVTAAMFAMVFVGALAMTIDVGRLYVLKSLAQTRVDAAALSGAVELDGDRRGLREAVRAVKRALSGSEADIRFASLQGGPWEPEAQADAGSRFVRVRVKADVPTFFMKVLNPAAAAAIWVVSTAGQVETLQQGRMAAQPGCPPQESDERFQQDTDLDSKTYEEYATAGSGNGRRLLLCRGPAGDMAAAFLSRPGHALENPIGSYVFGSRRRGAARAGAFVVRLVE